MKDTLRLGNTAEVRITVTEDMCPAFDEVVVHRVYSTWSMAHHMELAARMVLAPHLHEHEEGIVCQGKEEDMLTMADMFRGIGMKTTVKLAAALQQ